MSNNNEPSPTYPCGHPRTAENSENRQQSQAESEEILLKVFTRLMVGGMKKPPARWTPEYFASITSPIVAETILATGTSLSVNIDPGKPVPQWIRDLANEECVLAVAEVLEKDLQRHGY